MFYIIFTYYWSKADVFKTNYIIMYQWKICLKGVIELCHICTHVLLVRMTCLEDVKFYRVLGTGKRRACYNHGWQYMYISHQDVISFWILNQIFDYSIVSNEHILNHYTAQSEILHQMIFVHATLKSFIYIFNARYENGWEKQN